MGRIAREPGPKCLLTKLGGMGGALLGEGGLQRRLLGKAERAGLRSVRCDDLIWGICLP